MLNIRTFIFYSFILENLCFKIIFVILTLRNVKYQFNTKYLNNIITLC